MAEGQVLQQVFFVIEGAVTFKVHESSYLLCTGGMILVPRGNTYYIENIADRDAKLFFAQARRVSAEEEDPPEVLPASDREPTTAPRKRSNSVSQAPVTTRVSSERAPPGKRGASTKA
jgi:centromere protein C